MRDPGLLLVQPPPSIWNAAVGVTSGALLMLFVMVFVPWQQTASGTGSVVAYTPESRQQTVDAPVSGRLEKWLVQEGDIVETGQPLAQLIDNDPMLMERLLEQRRATEDELRSVDEQIRNYRAKVEAQRASLDFIQAEYEEKLAGLDRKRVGDEAKAEAARQNVERITKLAADGIVSQRDLEVAQMGNAEAKASLQARDAEIRATLQVQSKAAAEARTKLSSAEAELEAARAKRNEVERKLLDIDTKTSRQSQQLITAPRSGTVIQVLGGPGGGQVKAGDPLIRLVPITEDRAVQVWIPGNDMPFVQAGSKVRLVFEGWPALQVVGLPGASLGTFGGVVAFIDATDDGTGKFRALILPDPDDTPWPAENVLRQGVRTKAWMMLGRVTLGFEIWRQLNGFPPVPVTIEKGSSPLIPTSKKPRSPTDLK